MPKTSAKSPIKPIVTISIVLILLIAMVMGIRAYTANNHDASHYGESLSSGATSADARAEGSSRDSQPMSPGMHESDIVKYQGHHFQSY